MNFDVIVVGAGHAGCEAAHASAKLGAKTLLITGNIEMIAWLSCNPAMGGQSKGQIICEIDAMGGIIGQVTDRAGIQFRVINTSKGPAMQTIRVQCDRKIYHREMLSVLEKRENLYLMQDIVNKLIVKRNTVCGVECEFGGKILSNSVVLSCGTFLNGIIHVGSKSISAGRAAEKEVKGLSGFLKDKGIPTIRLKTGTPPRIDIRTVKLDKLSLQNSDKSPTPFSKKTKKIKLDQVPCYIAHTNKNTHKIIKDNIKKSAMYSGRIKSIGPRYCPSIEDKIVRFPDKDSHHVFLEPEGLNNYEYYVNGLSTSLPFSVQIDYLRSIEGLEKVHITRSGYAIEYDAFDPKYLEPTLESKVIRKLFLAGQINGTSGYEEAAGMGIIAGINAVKCSQDSAFTLDRMESYIGVMIDDLINKGVSEPYRMFTSRAENRLYLRIDNARKRLLTKSYETGLIDDAEYKKYKREERCFNRIYKYCNNNRINRYSISDLIKQKKIETDDLYKYIPENLQQKEILRNVWIEIYYEGYIKKSLNDLKKYDKYAELSLKDIKDYNDIKGLRKEAALKLNKYKPENILRARNIEGVNPADVLIIIINTIKKVKLRGIGNNK